MATSTIKNKIKSQTATLNDGDYYDFTLEEGKVYLLICNHPYTGNGGAYVVTGGYTTTDRILTLASSAYVSSITKPTASSLRVTAAENATLFASLLGGGKHLFAPSTALRCAA